jgi:hypothetical protein
MVIWSGFGFLPVIFLVFFGLGFTAGNNGPITDSALAYTFFTTGLVSGVLGWWLRKRPARTMIDKATGQEIVFRKSHSLFFIPLIYWGPIFIAMGCYQIIQVVSQN